MAKPLKEKIRQSAASAPADQASVDLADAERKKAAQDKTLAARESPEKSLVARIVGDGEEARGVFAAALTFIVVLFGIAVYFWPADKAHSGTALTFLIQIATAAVAFVVGKSRRGR